MACRIKVCTCKQCRAVKNKKKNRNAKIRIRRLMNKRRRKNPDGTVVNFYWA